MQVMDLHGLSPRGNLTVMGNLSYDWKVSARTTPEILRGLEALRSDCQAAGVKFHGRKLGLESLVNAALLALLADPGAVEVVRAQVLKLEAQLASGGPPGPPKAPDPPKATRPRKGHPRAVQVATLPPPRVSNGKAQPRALPKKPKGQGKGTHRKG